MNIIKSIIKTPLTICMTIILIIFLEILSIVKIPVKLLPDLNIPFLGITIIYPSARLDVVETDVTTKIEEGIKNISDFEFDTNLNEKMNEIKDALSKIKLPTNCEEPTISMVDFNASAVVNIFLDNAAINKINEIQD